MSQNPINKLVGSPVPVRHIAEIRFTPTARILDRSGQLIEAFSTPPFNHWQVRPAPFRAEVWEDGERREDRTKIAYVTIRNLGMEMEAPDSVDVFRDQLRRWVRILTEDRFLGRLTMTRIGYRSYYFAPVPELSYQQLTDRLSDMVLSGGSLLRNLPGYRIVDNSVNLNIVGAEEKDQSAVWPHRQG